MEIKVFSHSRRSVGVWASFECSHSQTQEKNGRERVTVKQKLREPNVSLWRWRGIVEEQRHWAGVTVCLV